MSLNDKLAALFKANPGVWLDGRRLAEVGGYAAWRTRVSELRAQRHMDIENRCRFMREHAPSCPALQAWDIPEACNCRRPRRFTISEYRWVPRVEPEQLPLNESFDRISA